MEAATCLPESLCADFIPAFQPVRYSAFSIMRPATRSHSASEANEFSAGGEVNNSNITGVDVNSGRELTAAEKAAATKLKNAVRVNNLETNVQAIESDINDLFTTMKELSDSVAQVAFSQTNLPNLIAQLMKEHAPARPASTGPVSQADLPPTQPRTNEAILRNHSDQDHVRQKAQYQNHNPATHAACTRRLFANQPGPAAAAKQTRPHITDTRAFDSNTHNNPTGSRTSTPRKQYNRLRSNRARNTNKPTEASYPNFDNFNITSYQLDDQARNYADSLLDSLNPDFPTVLGKGLIDPYTR